MQSFGVENTNQPNVASSKGFFHPTKPFNTYKGKQGKSENLKSNILNFSCVSKQQVYRWISDEQPLKCLTCLKPKLLGII